MQKLTPLVITLLISATTLGQNTAINLSSDYSNLNQIIIQFENVVFTINSERKLEEIMVFENKNESDTFMKRPLPIYKPYNSVNFEGIPILYNGHQIIKRNAYGDINMIGNTSVSTMLIGQGIKINNIEIMINSNSFVESIGSIKIDFHIIGFGKSKISRIGDLGIYYTSTDKIKSIGNLEFSYDFFSDNLEQITGHDDRVKLF